MADHRNPLGFCLRGQVSPRLHKSKEVFFSFLLLFLYSPVIAPLLGTVFFLMPEVVFI